MQRQRPPFTAHLTQLRTTFPFIGVSEVERRRGRPYRLRLGANECLFGMYPAAVRVLERRDRNVALYNDPLHHDLRTAIAARWGLSTANLVVAEGIEGLLELYVRALLEKNDAVVASRGSYPSVPFYVEACEGRMVYADYRVDGSQDFERLLQLTRESRAKILYIANPDNPSGIQLELEQLDELVRALPATCLLLLDEAYAEYADQAALLPLERIHPQVVRLRTFSKAYALAGARVGYAVADPELTQPLEHYRQHFSVSCLSQELALAAFEDASFLEHVVTETAQGRRHYAAIGEALGLKHLECAANFVTFDCGDSHRAEALRAWFEAHDILVQRPSIPPLDRCLRVTVAPEQQRKEFASSLELAVADVGPCSVR